MTLDPQLVTAAELADFRELAESRMGAENNASTVTVRRKTGQKNTDAKGYKRDQWADIAIMVPFRLGGSGHGANAFRTVTIGDTEVQVPLRVGSFPVTETAPRTGDLIDIVEGENAGLVFEIVEATGKDQATARRMLVYGVQRPSEWA